MTLFVRQPAAGCLGLGGIYGVPILVDLLDLAFQIDDEGGAVGYAHLRIEHPIQLGYFAVVVAEQRKLRVQFLGPMGKRCDEIRADGQNLRIQCIEFCDTRLVRRELLRSTTGESRREECQNHEFLATEIGKLNVLSAGVHAAADGEIRRGVADLEKCFRRRVLREHRYGGQSQGQNDRKFHDFLPRIAGAYHGRARDASK